MPAGLQCFDGEGKEILSLSDYYMRLAEEITFYQAAAFGTVNVAVPWVTLTNAVAIVKYKHRNLNINGYFAASLYMGGVTVINTQAYVSGNLDITVQIFRVR
jgi:hypothetical protein